MLGAFALGFVFGFIAFEIVGKAATAYAQVLCRSRKSGDTPTDRSGTLGGEDANEVPEGAESAIARSFAASDARACAGHSLNGRAMGRAAFRREKG